MTPFAAWQNFYVMVGSSASALTGLQFVVMALIANLPMKRGSAAVDAFATPTIVHFGAVLLLSGILSAPWRGVGAPTLLCGLCGVMGFVYAIVVARGRENKRRTNLSSRTGSFTSCSLPCHTASWLRPHTQLGSTWTEPFSASQPRRCFFSSSAFTTHGTVSRIWSSCVGRSSRKIPSVAADIGLDV